MKTALYIVAQMDRLEGKKDKLYLETLLVCVKFLYMLCLYIEKNKETLASI